MLILDGIHIFWPGIIVLGGVVGFLSGLFGVGGGFLLTPMLNIVFSVPMKIAIGSDLAQMIGTATTGAMRHRKEASIDVKLSLIMLGGTAAGVELGEQILQNLKLMGDVTLLGQVVKLVWLVPMLLYMVLLAIMGVSVFIESARASRIAAGGGTPQRRVGRGFFSRIHLPPMVRLEGTEGRTVPLFIIVYVAFAVGVLTGFMGIGGGIVYVPVLIYGIGCSTRMAIGTSLLVVLAGATFGTIQHALHYSVSLRLVMFIMVPGTIGACFGASLHHRLKPYHLRLYLSLLFFGALGVILLKMLHKFGAFG